MFSHGLAGSRNAYSYICGDLASKGMVVIAPDHRDGSSPIQHVRATPDIEARIVHQVKISHTANDEVYEARDKQLRIRLWEISMALEALVKIDDGDEVENLDENTSYKRKERVEVLRQFGSKMDVHRRGKVNWCGHSFGASTIVQLLKSIYYSTERPEDAGRPLVTPKAKAAIFEQITPRSTTSLLDLWGLPLQSPEQAFLWDKPLPAYADGGVNGDNVLSILSEGFNNWKGNLNIIKHTVTGPSNSRPQDSGYVSRDSPSPGPSEMKGSGEGPHMFFVERSQHFNHSDYGILFPWITKRFAQADDPERILELNTRAIVQVIREAGTDVPGTDDSEILERSSHIKRWISIPMDGDATKSESLEAVTRKLSNASIEHTAAPTDDTKLEL